MAASNPPKKGQAFTIDISLADPAANASIKISPSLSAGDFKLYGDGVLIGNLGTLPAETPAGSGIHKLILTGTEMNYDRVSVRGISQATPKEFADFHLCITTTA